jgi:hypothetical protein
MPEMLIVFLIVPFALLIFGLFIWSLVWVYRDAEARGKDGWLALVVVFFLNWPFSLLLWMLFRPDAA